MLSLLAGKAAAQEMEAPVEVQVPLLLKILTFDRKLGERAAGDDIVIAILYQGGFRASVIARDAVQDQLRPVTDSILAGHPIHWLALDLDNTPDLARTFAEQRVDVIYVAPLRGIGLDRIRLATRAKRVTSFTGVPKFVEAGLAVGIAIRAERPQILINLAAARAEGADFTSQLLKLVTLVGPGGAQ